MCLFFTAEMESSRIFIKGLPPTISEEEFRKHFSSKQAITDAKLIPHRRIGYVGYKTPEDAQKAVKYFNKSFIRMSKIGVEMARAVRLRSPNLFPLKRIFLLIFFFIIDLRHNSTPIKEGTERDGKTGSAGATGASCCKSSCRRRYPLPETEAGRSRCCRPEAPRVPRGHAAGLEIKSVDFKGWYRGAADEDAGHRTS